MSYSGGKDSSVLLHLVRTVYPNALAVFIDTGLEYPELRDHVKMIENVEWVKPSMNFRKVIEQYGYPVISKKVAGYVYSARRNRECKRAKYLNGEVQSKIFGFGDGKYWYLVDAPFNSSDYCCNKLKKEPVKHFQKRSGLKPILGTMACESIGRKNTWLKNGCNSFDGAEQISRPLSFWTEQDILEYIEKFNIKIPSVYGEVVKDKNGKYSTTGCTRTGCIYCAFGAHLEKEPNRFQKLKITHPKLWNYCMKPWDSGGLGMRPVLEYIGVKVE